MPADHRTPDQIAAEADAAAVGGFDALERLAKGFGDSLATLEKLLKGKGGAMPGKGGEPEPDGDEPAGDGDEPDPDGDEPAGDGDEPAGDGDEPDPDAEPDGDGPGYNDLAKGADGDYLDATEVIAAMQADIAAGRKDNAALRKDNAALRKSVRGLAAAMERVEQLVAASAAMTVPMAKGLAAVHAQMLELPAAVHNPGLDARRAVVRHHVETPAPPAGERLPNVVLSKGLRARVISEAQLDRYNRTGRFVEDDAANKKILDDVSKA